jgi:hypothetical protein
VIAVLKFNLSDPDDERAHRYALAGRDALLALAEIDEHCRGRLKHGAPSVDATHDLQAVRAMVPHELVNLLH